MLAYRRGRRKLLIALQYLCQAMCGNVSLLPEDGVEDLEHGVLRRNSNVELLLRVTVEYEATKLHDDVDRESC